MGIHDQYTLFHHVSDLDKCIIQSANSRALVNDAESNKSDR